MVKTTAKKMSRLLLVNVGGDDTIATSFFIFSLLVHLVLLTISRKITMSVSLNFTPSPRPQRSADHPSDREAGCWPSILMSETTRKLTKARAVICKTAMNFTTVRCVSVKSPGSTGQGKARG